MFLLFAALGLADASTVIGNPSVTIDTTDAHPVLLWTLELTRCSDSTVVSLPLRTWVDPDQPLEVTLPTGEFCIVDAILDGPPTATIISSDSSDELHIESSSNDEVLLVLDTSLGEVRLENLP
jgi:hypothetical protein